MLSVLVTSCCCVTVAVCGFSDVYPANAKLNIAIMTKPIMAAALAPRREEG